MSGSATAGRDSIEMGENGRATTLNPDEMGDYYFITLKSIMQHSNQSCRPPTSQHTLYHQTMCI